MSKKSTKGYKGSFTDIALYQQKLSSYNEDSGEFNPYDIIDQSMYKNTARGRMAYQQDLAKLLYLAQINQENRMNEYNSPKEQVERMREAGLNPDLNGVDNVPASNVAGYQGNPMDGTQSSLQNVSDVFGIISSVTNIVGTLVSGAQSIFSNPLGLASDALRLFESAPASLDLQSFIDSSPIPRRTKRRLSNYLYSYQSSIPYVTKDYDENSANIESRFKFHKLRNNPIVSPPFVGDSFEEYKAYTDALSPLIELENNVMFEELNAKFHKASYEVGRYDYSSGVDERHFEQVQRDMYRALRKPILDTINNLKRLSNRYPWATWAQGAVSAVVLANLNF